MKKTVSYKTSKGKKKHRSIPCKLCKEEVNVGDDALGVICWRCLLYRREDVARLASGEPDKKLSNGKKYLLFDQRGWSDADRKKITNFNRKIEE